MDKYVIVRNGCDPSSGGCNYLSSVDKDGLHFTGNIDDAIVVNDQERCVFLARALTRGYHTVDVYLVKEETVIHFDYVW